MGDECIYFTGIVFWFVIPAIMSFGRRNIPVVGMICGAIAGLLATYYLLDLGMKEWAWLAATFPFFAVVVCVFGRYYSSFYVPI